MTITDIIEGVLKNEGGYVNDPRDAGGETNWGITAKVARARGYAGSMKAMPREVAFEIYRGQYVVQPGFGMVGNLSMPIAAELVDTGVNMGPAVAGRMLQRALNLVTDAGLVVDGQIGEASLKALRSFLDKRGKEGERRLLALLNAFQGERYASLAEGRAANRAFIYGWLARILPEAA
jgi:lysozyme family protein